MSVVICDSVVLLSIGGAHECDSPAFFLYFFYFGQPRSTRSDKKGTRSDKKSTRSDNSKIDCRACLLACFLACLLVCLLAVACFACFKSTFQAYFRAWRSKAWLPDASGCLGQGCLGQQLFPACKALSSPFAGLADQGMVARCFRVLGAAALPALKALFLAYFRAWRTRAWLPDASGCLERVKVLGAAVCARFQSTFKPICLLACFLVVFRAPAATPKQAQNNNEKNN